MAKCRICYDTEWVCENHVDRPWSKTLPNGCECGAGAPCILQSAPPRQLLGCKVHAALSLVYDASLKAQNATFPETKLFRAYV